MTHWIAAKEQGDDTPAPTNKRRREVVEGDPANTAHLDADTSEQKVSADRRLSPKQTLPRQDASTNLPQWKDPGFIYGWNDEACCLWCNTLTNTYEGNSLDPRQCRTCGLMGCNRCIRHKRCLFCHGHTIWPSEARGLLEFVMRQAGCTDVQAYARQVGYTFPQRPRPEIVKNKDCHESTDERTESEPEDEDVEA